MNLFIYIVEIVVGIGFIIFIHELGHFITSKMIGVRVRRFYLGFAPKIPIGRRKIPLRLFAFKYGETEYGVGLLPLGGFVDIEGQDPTRKLKGTPDEFLSKSAGQRALVFVAGSAMNAISAFLLFLIAFAIGVSFIRPVVGTLKEGSPAWRAGIRTGDLITAVNGKPIEEFQEFWTEVALLAEGEKAYIEVERNGERLKFEMVPERDPLGRGMSVGISQITNRIEDIMEGSPASRAGIQPNWRLMEVEFFDRMMELRSAKGITSPIDFQEILLNRCRGGEEVTLHFLIDEETGERRSITIVTERHPGYKKIFRLGITPAESMRVKTVRATEKETSPLREGDLIVRANGIKVYSALQLEKISYGAEEVELLVAQADGTETKISIGGKRLRELLEDALLFERASAEREPVCGFVMPDMPAARIGLKPGDRVLSFNDIEVKTFAELAQLVSRTQGAEAKIVWLTPEGVRKEALVAPIPANVAMVGLIFGPLRFIKQCSIFSAVSLGLKRTCLWAKRVFLVLRSLFYEKTVSPKHLAGPVGIISTSFMVARLGLGTFIYFLALISINLAIVNLLPIPILDGGHLLFLGIEKLKGSPLAPKTQVTAQLIALMFLFALIIFVTYNDIARLVTMP